MAAVLYEEERSRSLKAVGALNKGRKKEKSLARVIWGWLFFVFMMIVVIYLVVHAVSRRTKVIGSGMYPTFEDGDYLLMDSFVYRITSPKRYDVIIFPFKYQDDTWYVKRVIGLPGETVQIIDGQIYINGSLLEEPGDFGPISSAGLASSLITLGEDEYFVLGDNRDIVSDSREPTVGNVKREDILGKAVLRIWPLKHFGIIR